MSSTSGSGFRSLRTKLLVVTLALALVPLGGLLALGISQLHALLLEQSGLALRVQAEQILDKIERNRFERYGDVQAFAANPLAQGTGEEIAGAADFYTRTYGMYDLMLVVDLEGKVLAANRVSFEGKPIDSHSLVGTSMAGEPWFAAAARLKPTESYFSDVVKDDRLAHIAGGDGRVLIYAAPVFDAAGKAVRYWCNYASFARSVAAILSDQRKDLAARGQRVETDLLTRQGVLIDGADEAGWLQSNLAEAGVRAAAALGKGEAGFEVSRRGPGQPEALSGFASSRGALGFAGNGWGAVVRISVDQIEALIRPVQTGALLLGLLVAALVGVAAFVVAHQVARPVKQASGLLLEIGEGEADLTQRLPEVTRDEIGALARGFNAFSGKLEDIVVRTKGSAEEVSLSARQVADSTEHLSNGAQTQAASVIDATSRLSDQVHALKEQSAAARAARELSIQSQAVAEKGGETVGRAQKAMQDIKESSKAIGNIIGTIDEIAFQTNLLSLNAAVEAARAGEHGRGFAVVASEVRALAQKSAGAAKEIKGLIQESLTRVEAGAKLANDSGRTLTEINQASRKVADMINDLATQSESQSREMETIAGSMGNIDRVTQEIAAQSEELNATAESLSSRAGEISALLAGFKVSGGARAAGLEGGAWAERSSDAPARRPSAEESFYGGALEEAEAAALEERA